MNTRVRIKICGVTRPDDAGYAADLGVDAIGLVFYQPSPRAVSIEKAREILAELPALVTVVGLFVDANQEEVRQVLDSVPLDLLQFHGDETESYCTAFSRPYMKVLKVKPELDIAEQIAIYSSASAILLDAWHKELAGGTGEQFDWSLVPKVNTSARLVLAGGLSPENVVEAVTRVWPYAVDVSSGVESEPGIKSPVKMKRFVEQVKKLEREDGA